MYLIYFMRLEVFSVNDIYLRLFYNLCPDFMSTLFETDGVLR